MTYLQNYWEVRQHSIDLTQVNDNFNVSSIFIYFAAYSLWDARMLDLALVESTYLGVYLAGSVYNYTGMNANYITKQVQLDHQTLFEWFSACSWRRFFLLRFSSEHEKIRRQGALAQLFISIS